ncbi:TetR/AcrR family transcriptional regulator [Mycobacteroides salmoniphilum]|uniref:DNA-binding transcriptional repressor FabR n=1 Tax=Mycobacteroides salmoniphilum TaxID=404941 RepID=A0A4R8SCF8_9MYCO|nr:TetR/AcrR family transcriptional regulator [Mycobacteroides salmoniphilum]TDZ92998.1 DNA-binding transcriptional repressor FabR [Mycobacteroides salmoniphilum]TEA07589.1 DNA-binding transcriptional repressor FabR [Mycobacteroides salmoniphilum]
MDEIIPGASEQVLDLLAGGAPQHLPRHRHQLSRNDVLQAQRARISAAAIELFAEAGYACTTVLHIAQKAGVSRKTFYELYSSKEAVFLDAYQTLGALLKKLGLNAPAEQRSSASLEQVAVSIATLLKTMGANGSATRMFYLEALGAGPRVRARRNDAIDEFTAAIAPGMRELRRSADPTLPPLGHRLPHLIVAACIELITEFLADHDPNELPTLTSDLTEVVRAIAIPTYPEQKSSTRTKG